jgi:ABC-2 type transport system ATP-binding protein
LIQQSGRTVFFSTHILSDVDRVADRVVVLSHGRVLAQGPLADLRARYTKASFLFATPPKPDLVIPGALRVQKGMREWVAVFDAAEAHSLTQLAASVGATDCLVQGVTAEDVFVELFQGASPPNGNGVASGVPQGVAAVPPTTAGRTH